MRWRRFGNKIVVRVDRGEEVVASLRQACSDSGVQLAAISGIGAVDRAVVGLFVAATKQYESVELAGDMEITSLAGNLASLDGQAYVHLHVTLSDASHQALGGHLNSAVVSGTCEIVVDVLDGSLERVWNPEVGLNTLEM